MVAPNPFAPPESDLFGEGVPSDPRSRGQFRSGRVLVHAAVDGEFADRCVRCDAPSTGDHLKRSLYWHAPWVYALLITGPLLYALVTVIVRKRGTVHVGLCERHRRARRNVLMAAWLGSITAISSCNFVGDSAPGMIVVAFFAVIGLAAWGIIGGRVVYPVKIDERWIHLRGVCDAYLAHLPEWRR